MIYWKHFNLLIAGGNKLGRRGSKDEPVLWAIKGNETNVRVHCKSRIWGYWFFFVDLICSSSAFLWNIFPVAKQHRPVVVLDVHRVSTLLLIIQFCSVAWQDFSIHTIIAKGAYVTFGHLNDGLFLGERERERKKMINEDVLYKVW